MRLIDREKLDEDVDDGCGVLGSDGVVVVEVVAVVGAVGSVDGEAGQCMNQS